MTIRTLPFAFIKEMLGDTPKLATPVMVNAEGPMENEPILDNLKRTGESETPPRLSESAVKEALALRHSTPEYSGKDLRLYLEGKGCDGFYYGVTFDERTPQDVIFPQEVEVATESLMLVVDPETLQFVHGSMIDWVDDDRGRGFLVDNPNQKAFRGKFFKRNAWKEKLQTSKPTH